MPDRAVVDEKSIRAALAQIYNSECCDKCGGPLYHFDVGDVQCQECGRTGDDIERDLRTQQPHPLAVVAISEDRQWLVVHQVSDPNWFVIYDVGKWGYEEYSEVEDTGQSADEVLAAFLREQELEDVERQEREYPGFA